MWPSLLAVLSGLLSESAVAQTKTPATTPLTTTTTTTPESVPRRINFSPKRAQAGSIEHTVAFREALLDSPLLLPQHGFRAFVVRRATEPFKFQSLEYFWDASYVDPSDAFPVICSNPIEPSDPKLGKIAFSNGSRPREIAWRCPPSHGCCGYECCEEPTLGRSMIRLVIVLIALSIACFFILECARWSLGACAEHCVFREPLRQHSPLPTTAKDAGGGCGEGPLRHC